jgi:gamma-glutamyl:cysteine ligase YbdK (ATP-grasp superfamily)
MSEAPMKTLGKPLGLFEAWGIEIELVIVDRDTLDVRPIADVLLREASGGDSGDHEEGSIGWSNELVLHLVELKCARPAPTLAALAPAFQESVRRIDALLEAHGARLLPGGMHPWMDPRRETRLWPHAYAEVYRTYDRIFDCARHGYANLQSTHVNLPFADDSEFARLHAAVRLVLPLVPALAASSPLLEGRVTGCLDQRLAVYATNSRKVPELAGRVIPERIFGVAEYRAGILAPIEAALAPHDRDGHLQPEFANSRGAIARFDRGAIEIRLLDAQENPRADLALAFAVGAVVRALVEERLSPLEVQQGFEIEPLARLLESTVAHGPDATLCDPAYLAALGRDPRPLAAGELWRELVDELVRPAPDAAEFLGSLDLVLERGTLSQRILRALGGDVSRARVGAVYRELADCLHEGRPFEA